MAYSLDYYKRSLRNKQNELNTRKAKNKKLKGEIERLEAAYEKLKRIKDNASPDAEYVKKQVKINKLAPDVAWRGKSKKDFDKIIDNEAEKAAKDFYKSIDRMLDQVGSELSRKRGSYDTGIGAVNALNKSINWLSGVIRNWTN